MVEIRYILKACKPGCQMRQLWAPWYPECLWHLGPKHHYFLTTSSMGKHVWTFCLKQKGCCEKVTELKWVHRCVLVLSMVPHCHDLRKALLCFIHSTSDCVCHTVARLLERQSDSSPLSEIRLLSVQCSLNKMSWIFCKNRKCLFLPPPPSWHGSCCWNGTVYCPASLVLGNWWDVLSRLSWVTLYEIRLSEGSKGRGLIRRLCNVFYS
jgi:hypothetical protein